jgi:hypothetical protein
MEHFSFNVPVHIGGLEVILVKDIVGNPPLDPSVDHSYINVSRATKDVPSICVFQDEIINLRNEFPTLPVVGIWQLMFHNNLIDWTFDNYLVKNTDTCGTVLVRSSREGFIDNSVLTDHLVGGYCSSLVSSNNEKTYEIDIDFNDLILPSNFILTNEEIRSFRKEDMKKANIKGFFICVAIIVAATAIAFYSSSKNKSDREKENIALLQLSDTTQLLNSIKRTRYPVIDSYNDRLIKLATLYLEDEKISTPTYKDENKQQASLSSEKLSIMTSTDFFYDPSEKWDWVESTRLPINKWLVTF